MSTEIPREGTFAVVYFDTTFATVLVSNTYTWHDDILVHDTGLTRIEVSEDALARDIKSLNATIVCKQPTYEELTREAAFKMLADRGEPIDVKYADGEGDGVCWEPGKLLSVSVADVRYPYLVQHLDDDGDNSIEDHDFYARIRIKTKA